MSGERGSGVPGGTASAPGSQNRYLDRVYGADTPEKTRDLYNAWAASYDDEIREAGYVTPRRCARALHEAAGTTDLVVLDWGCGTGLSGLALREEGFEIIDGLDISEEMLARAARREGIYRKLILTTPDEPCPFEPGTYSAIVAAGAIGAGAAPPEVIDALIGHLGSGGYLVLSLNDHALADPGYEGRLLEHVDCGAAELLFREHGPHLPGIGLEASVYVLRKR